MQQITVLTDDADQVVKFPLPDGTTLDLEFIYRAGVQRWTMNLSHASLIQNGMILTVDPNILRPWKNVVAFGIAILSITGLDPFQPTDFLDGTCTVNILSAAEVQQVETDVLAPVALVNP